MKKKIKESIFVNCLVPHVSQFERLCRNLGASEKVLSDPKLNNLFLFLSWNCYICITNWFDELDTNVPKMLLPLAFYFSDEEYDIPKYFQMLTVTADKDPTNSLHDLH